MSIFETIKNAIFGSEAKAAEAPTSTPAGDASGTPASSATGATPAADVDVAAVLDAAVAKSGQTLHWKTSIVDLMKALGLDSSLAKRQELAKELGYTGDANDSATMNVWLHKQVIAKLKANGGKVPADLG
ncbi:DUF3597 domain-containing protein [Hansschlegelia plantiphila]|uniref:DUF3597 domain-containing protein n=1 Tax=Hansschlegelia plantiphila TaxID=374655 RepID=A0A9W6IZ81_9HYPH|nr:DUF3597 domain-containing protein [Hansschlegelia plantiphila]GLK66374.1 hypothetical protein GCM10008179_00120 [Hansschlegelia plantiphila]